MLFFGLCGFRYFRVSFELRSVPQRKGLPFLSHLPGCFLYRPASGPAFRLSRAAAQRKARRSAGFPAIRCAHGEARRFSNGKALCEHG